MSTVKTGPLTGPAIAIIPRFPSDDLSLQGKNIDGVRANHKVQLFNPAANASFCRLVNVSGCEIWLGHRLRYNSLKLGSRFHQYLI